MVTAQKASAVRNKAGIKCPILTDVYKRQVVKTKDQITYYGGKTQQMEKNTRVKARVKAQAFRELVETKDKVVVMGHKMPDADAFGSAVAIYRAADVYKRQ